MLKECSHPHLYHFVDDCRRHCSSWCVMDDPMRNNVAFDAAVAIVPRSSL